MKRTKAQRVRAAVCGPVLGLMLAVPVGGLLAGAAGADQANPCYTGCTPTTTGITHHAGCCAGRRSGDDDGGRDDFDCTVHVQWVGVHWC